MSNDMVKVSSAYERIVHWMMAGSCILLIVTGLGIMFRQLGHVIPLIFGGFYAMRAIHHGAGVVFTVALVLAFLIWVKECAHFDSDDVAWMKVAGGYLGGNPKLPEMGKFNTGQKMFFFIIVIFGVLVSLSGYVMWFPASFSRDLVQWSYLVHAASMFMLTAGWLAHWYLGTIANPGGFSAITTGWVPRAYIKSHQPKYYREHVAKHN
jgi:formate dehydrogenase subunit gamma